MILAAAAYAEGQGPPPRELSLAQEFRRWGLPPRAGGLLDQPAGLLDRIYAAEQVYQAFAEYGAHGHKPGQMAKWKKEHPDLWNTVETVRSMRSDRSNLADRSRR